jgi:hypothetical protein
MTPSRPLRGNFWLLAFACLAVALAPLRAATDTGFSSTLTSGQRSATGLDQLTDNERDILDVLVASDLATARQLRTTTFTERFSDRHDGQQAAGLERLNADQLAQFDELVADAIAAQPMPKDRPRLKDNEVVSLKRRLEVHGGMSFTLGWASGGRNFREAGAWVSYFDPQTGLGLAVGFSQYSGDAIYPYGYYPGYGYGYYPYGPGGWYGGAPGDTFGAELTWNRPNFALGVGFSQTESSRPARFDGTGASLRGPANRRF